MNRHSTILRRVRKQIGFSLIEGLISIALFSFGVLAIMGMQAQSIKHVFNLPDIFRPVFALIAHHACNKF